MACGVDMRSDGGGPEVPARARRFGLAVGLLCVAIGAFGCVGALLHGPAEMLPMSLGMSIVGWISRRIPIDPLADLSASRFAEPELGPDAQLKLGIGMGLLWATLLIWIVEWLQGG